MMKRSIIIVLALIISGLSFSQETEFLNYKLTDDKELIWQKVYETELDLEELGQYFSSIPFSSELEIRNEKIVGRSQKTKLSSTKGVAMMAYQPYTAFIKIEAKEGKYRVTVQEVQFDPIETSVYSGGIGISSDVNGTWEDLAVRDKHHEIRKNNTAKKFLTILDSDLNDVFQVKEKVKEDW